MFIREHERKRAVWTKRGWGESAAPMSRPSPYQSETSRLKCPAMRKIQTASSRLAIEHPTCLLVFTHFLLFVFVLHILKAIQKEKSNVAIKFAGIFIIYVLFYFV